MGVGVGAVVYRYRYGTNKQIFVASRCLGSSVLLSDWDGCGVGTRAIRLAGSGAVGGARSWGRGSGRINGRRQRPDRTGAGTETETQATRSAQRCRNEQWQQVRRR